MSSSILVGTKACPITTLGELIRPDPLISQRWSTLARELGIPNGRIKKFRQDFQLDKITYDDVIHEMLELWVGLNGSNAELETLINIVERFGAINVGEKIREKFQNIYTISNSHKRNSCIPTILQNFVGDPNPTTTNYPGPTPDVKIICHELPKSVDNWSADQIDGSVEAFRSHTTEIHINEFTNNVVTGIRDEDAKQNSLPLFKNTIPKQLNYYVKRTITTRSVLSFKIFERSGPDIFMFIGMEWNELTELVKNNCTGLSSNQVNQDKITVKYMILDHPTHFEKVCKLTNEPVHLIRKEKVNGSEYERLIWVNSRGEMGGVQRHVDNLQQDLIEDLFFDDVAVQSTLPICISDTPGMGKSILLGQIAYKLTTRFPERTVIFLVMSELIKRISELITSKNQNEKSAIREALQDMTCKNELGRIALASKLSSGDPNLIELLLDGFDEVDLVDSKLALEVLGIIKNAFKSTRLWVTSRPHLLEELECKFNVFGYNIKPFTCEDQVQFLIAYWSEGKVLCMDKLKQFAKECLEMLKENMCCNDHEIAGIPLQCLLLAEVYEDDAVETTHFQCCVKSITSLYRKLVEKRMQKYRSGTQDLKLTESELIDIHVRLSLELLLPWEFYNFENAFRDTLDVEKKVLKFGILESSSQGQGKTFKFIHRTFAEYFVASFIMDTLRHNCLKNALNKSLFETIMSCSKFHISISDTHITSYRFSYPVINYFLDSLLTECPETQYSSAQKNQLFKRSNYPLAMRKLAHACANDGLLNLFSIIDKTGAFEGNEKLVFDEEFILVLINSSKLEFLKIAFTHFERHHKFNQDMKTKSLRVAVGSGDISIVEYLVKEKHLHDIVKATMTLLHDCTKYSNNNSKWRIHQKIQLIGMLVKVNPWLLEERMELGRTPLLGKDIHIRLLQELIVKFGADVLAYDEKGDTILHLNRFRRLSAQNYHILVESIEEEKLKKILKLKNRAGLTPLMKLIKKIDPLPETLYKLRKVGADLNAVDFGGNSPLAIAVKAGRNATTLNKLIEYGADVKWTKGWKRKGLLHYAAEYGNLEAVDVLVKCNIDVNVKDLSRSTPLDYAIWSDKKVGKIYETAVELRKLGGRFTEILISGRSMIHVASLKGHLDAIRLLLHTGVDVNLLDKHKNTPLHFGVTEHKGLKDYFEVVRLLLDHKPIGANPNLLNIYDENPFHLALKNKHLTLKTFQLFKETVKWSDSLANLALRFLVSNGMSLNNVEFKSLVCFCEGHGAKLNFTDRYRGSLLHIAVLNKNVALLKYLVEGHKIDVNLRNLRKDTPLHLACDYQDIHDEMTTIQYLIDNGADPFAKDCFELSVLHKFISTYPSPSPGQFHAMAEYLIGKNLVKLFNTPGGANGCSPLQWAVERLEVEKKTLSLLDSQKVSFDWVDKNGDNLLAYALRGRRSVEFLYHLNLYGVDWTHHNKKNESLLHIAARDGTLEAVKVCLEWAWLDLNSKDSEGNTPLHCAAKAHFNRMEKCELLVELGGDVTAKNDEEFTPREIVRRRRDSYRKDELVDLLKCDSCDYDYNVMEFPKIMKRNFMWYLDSSEKRSRPSSNESANFG